MLQFGSNWHIETASGYLVLDSLIATIERLHMMSQHSNSLATATAAILVHNESCAPKWPPFP